jgi:hypothetical protein
MDDPVSAPLPAYGLFASSSMIVGYFAEPAGRYVYRVIHL